MAIQRASLFSRPTFMRKPISDFCDASDLTCLMVTCRVSKELFSKEFFWIFKADLLYVKIPRPLQPNIAAYYRTQTEKMCECVSKKPEGLSRMSYRSVLDLTVKDYHSSTELVARVPYIKGDLVEFLEIITEHWSWIDPGMDKLTIEDMFISAAGHGALKTLKSILSKVSISHETKFKALCRIMWHLTHFGGNYHSSTVSFLMEGESFTKKEKEEIINHALDELYPWDMWKFTESFGGLPISYDAFDVIMLFKDFIDMSPILTAMLFQMAVQLGHRGFIEWKIDEIEEQHILTCYHWAMKNDSQSRGALIIWNKLFPLSH